MSKEQIEAAMFESDQYDRMNEDAAEIKRRNEAGPFAGLGSSPVTVKEGVFDADPVTAAWIWAREKLILLGGGESRDTCMTPIRRCSIKDYGFYTICWDSHTVCNIALLINDYDGQYKVDAVINPEYCRELKDD